jgi:hypothetical protein
LERPPEADPDVSAPRCAGSIPRQKQEREKLLFLKKKKQKDFYSVGIGLRSH